MRRPPPAQRRRSPDRRARPAGCRAARWRRVRILFAIVASLLLVGWSYYQSERWNDAELASSAGIAALTAPAVLQNAQPDARALPLGVWRRSLELEVAEARPPVVARTLEPRANGAVMARLVLVGSQATRDAEAATEVQRGEHGAGNGLETR